jgi:LuxR family maltose regulon positive regulatory protein
VYGALADLELMRGKLRSADAYWHQALDAIEHPRSQGLIPLPVIGWVHLRLGELLYERNDLVAAREHLEYGAKSAALGDDPRVQIAGAALMARLRLTEGDLDAAARLLDDARRLVDRSRSAFVDWAARFDRCQLDIWLARGERHQAVGWVLEYLAGNVPAAELDRSIADLAACHILIAQGDAASLQQAAGILDPLLTLASTAERAGIQIEALAMQALLHQRRGQIAEAMASLEHALRMAEPEGYIRLFVDLGLPMAKLLQEARSRHVMESYVAMLLQAFGADVPVSSGGQRLPEPLSPRELEVLRLVAAGLTNDEIAGKLFISAETVKKHTGSIYGKLGVGNRTGAATRARELGLLDE